MNTQKVIISNSISSLMKASSKLNGLLRKNTPRINAEQFAIIRQVEQDINKEILELQDFVSTE